MAIIQNPVIGRARKQAGGMVFSKMYDKNVMRAKPAQVTPSNSTPQQGQRAFITLLTAFSKSFSVDNLIKLYPNKPASRSRYSELQKQLSAGRDVVGATATINFDSILSIGNGVDVPFIVPTLDVSLTEITISWTPSPVPSSINSTDRMFAVLFNSSYNSAVLVETEETYADANFVVSFPYGWTSSDDIIAYVGVVATKFKPGSELSSTVKKCVNA